MFCKKGILTNFTKFTGCNGLVPGALLTDLSKACDSLPHDLLAAKLIPYGVEISSIRLLYGYLSNKRLRTKVGNKYSSWRDILSGVPQGSILGPLLFSIYIVTFLLVNYTNIADYVGDTTPYVSGDNTSKVVALLERSVNVMFNWFTDNQMKGNGDKCHVLLSID